MKEKWKKENRKENFHLVSGGDFFTIFFPPFDLLVFIGNFKKQGGSFIVLQSRLDLILSNII